MPNQEHETEIKHIAIGTYPQPEGELLPPRHGERRDDEDGHRWGIPLWQGAGTGFRLVFRGYRGLRRRNSRSILFPDVFRVYGHI